MISETAETPTFSMSNIKGMVLAVLVLYLLAVTGIFALGATFRGHVQI